jgi:hypothetical protein
MVTLKKEAIWFHWFKKGLFIPRKPCSLPNPPQRGLSALDVDSDFKIISGFLVLNEFLLSKVPTMMVESFLGICHLEIRFRQLLGYKKRTLKYLDEKNR